MPDHILKINRFYALTHWSHEEKARRQAALGLDTGKDRLEQTEIEFYEKFIALGQVICYIQRPGSLPSNDFVWLSNENLEFEQKTTKARYESIHGQIVKASSRAAKQGVVKENFIIDICDVPLTNQLRESLGGFNIGREKYLLNELWVMSQGHISRVVLRTE